MKRFAILILTAALLCALLPAPALAWFVPDTPPVSRFIPTEQINPLFVKKVSTVYEAPEGYTPLRSVGDMRAILQAPGGSYIMMTDIDLSDQSELIAALNAVDFAGVLDGNGHQLALGSYSYTYDGTNLLCAGLFNHAEHAEFRNLYLTGSCTLRFDVTWYDSLMNLLVDELPDMACGGLLGYTGDGVRIDNCTTNVNISVDAPDLESLAQACAYPIADSEESLVLCAGGLAGIVGGAGETTISNCRNYGSITCFGQVGGLCGIDAGDLTHFRACENYGPVTALCYFAGGIVGYESYNADFAGCVNHGAVVADNCAGGIVGMSGNLSGHETTTISGCLNAGAVKVNLSLLGELTAFLAGDPAAGGIVGIYDANIDNCLSIGTVSGGCALSGDTEYPNLITNCVALEDSGALVSSFGSDHTGSTRNCVRVSGASLLVQDALSPLAFGDEGWALREGMPCPYPAQLMTAGGWIIYSADAWDSDLAPLKGNEVREAAIEAIMEQYEFSDAELQGTIICVAEGYGAHPDMQRGQERSSALMVVWKNGEIVLAVDTCASFPDYSGDASKNSGSPVPTIKDGKLSFRDCQHNVRKSNMGYPALKICGQQANINAFNRSLSAPAVRIDGSRVITNSSSDACNIHMKYSETLAPENQSWGNSTGCTVLGIGHHGNYDLGSRTTDIYARLAAIIGFADDWDGNGYADNVLKQTPSSRAQGILVINRAYGYEHVPEFRSAFNAAYSNCPGAIDYILGYR